VRPSHLGNGSPRGSPPTDLEKSESDRIKNFCILVLSAVMVFITVALSHYKDMKPLYSTTSHKEVHLSNLLVAEGLLLFMTIMCAVVLVMVEIFVSSQHNRRCRAWYRVLTVLVAVTGMLLILADTVLVVITNKSNKVLQLSSRR
jgi:formate hydrogenlyase subunit 3/multisubunit Na+/H+ antiporter MnhD subunit